MLPEGYADKSVKFEQGHQSEPATPKSPSVDWRTLYLAEKQRADTLAGLLKRRHALDPIEVAEALTDQTTVNPKD